MAKAGWIDIVHSETGMRSEVIESTLPAWETAGWTRADNGSEGTETVTPSDPAPAPSPEQQGGTPPSDPNEEYLS